MTQSGEWNVPVHLIPKPEEVTRILAEAKERCLRDYVFFLTSANTGLRISEVMHIRKEHLFGSKVSITRRKKKHLKPETIELLPVVAEALGEWAKDKADWLFPGKQAPCVLARNNGEVIEICKGGHASIRHLQGRWKRMLVDIGLYMPHRGVHSLRHYFGTEFQKQFKDLISTQAALGHSSPSMTAKYAHAVEMGEKMRQMRPTT